MYHFSNVNRDEAAALQDKESVRDSINEYYEPMAREFVSNLKKFQEAAEKQVYTKIDSDIIRCSDKLKMFAEKNGIKLTSIGASLKVLTRHTLDTNEWDDRIKLLFDV